MADFGGSSADMGAYNRPHTAAEVRQTAEIVSGGSILEGLDGAGAVVLAIVALAGIFPVTLSAVATIVVGVALLAEGGAIAARYSRVLDETHSAGLTATELGGGVSAEFIGGIAGIVLGILALLGRDAVTLMAIAVIVFSAALLFGSGTTSRLSALPVLGAGMSERAMRLAREAVLAAASAQVLIGLAGAILGILAVIHIVPMVLIEVALLALGASLLFSGAAVTGRLIGTFRRPQPPAA